MKTAIGWVCCLGLVALAAFGCGCSTGNSNGKREEPKAEAGAGKAPAQENRPASEPPSGKEEPKEEPKETPEDGPDAQPGTGEPSPGGAGTPETPEPGPPQVSLSGDLMPVFERSCAACHARQGGNKAAVAGGVFFDRREDILGRAGKSVIPGKPEDSAFLKVLNGTMPVGKDRIVMPPPGAGFDKWSAGEIEAFARWIREGAKDN